MICTYTSALRNARLTAWLRRFALSAVLLVGVVPSTLQAEVERWSQLADPLFIQLNPDQGLPTRFITSVTEDRDGFLWIGTSGGLARWDGYHFKTYKAGANDPSALPSSYIVSLHKDEAGTLWVGTAGGGLARHERGSDRFTVFGVGANGVSHGHIWAMDDDGAGGLWVATDGGLDHLNANGTWTHENHNASDPNSLPDDHVNTLLRDSKGRLWVGTRRGVARRDAGTSEFVVVPLPGDGGPQPEIWRVFEDSDKRIWIGAKNRGAYVIETEGAEPRSVIESGGGALARQTVNTIAEAAPGQMWIGTFGQGSVVVDVATWQTRRLQHAPDLPYSLVHDDVRAIHLDRAGFLWIGTSGGLARHDTRQTAVRTIFGELGRTGGLTDVDVWSVLAAADGRIWAGLREGGVDILDPQGTRVGGLRPDPNRPTSALPRDRVYALAQAATGDVFVGTNRGLYRADADGRRVQRVAVDPKQPDMAVRTLKFADGILWVGTLWNGLWQFDTAKNVGVRHWDGDALTGERVETILPAGDGTLWVGGSAGLNRLDIATGEVEKIVPIADDANSLSAAWASALTIDNRGRLWVGTLGGGINIMEGRDESGRPRFTRLGEAQGLPNGSAAKLQTDSDGKIWVGTNDGLAVIDPDTLAVRPMRRSEGVAITFNWVNSGDVTADNEVLFGGSGGLTIIRPERVRPWTYRPPVVVVDLRVGGQKVDWTTDRRLTVPADANSLAVEFAALDYSAPERNRYAYKLEGYDKDWIETPWTQRLASYTNLPPGDYTLSIRGSNRDGMWADTLSLPINVQPAWYQTWWFRSLAALGVLGLFSLLVRARTAILYMQKKVLEQEVAERTSELSAANRRLFDLATTDTLTGCANRRHLIERANQTIALAHRSNHAVCLLIADLDHFKRINDTYGHIGGDTVLCSTARILTAHVRTSDILARIGGEEFAVLMPGTDLDGSLTLAERLRQAVGDTFVGIENKAVRVTTSIGLAMLEKDETFDSLFARADAALYAAKRSGRNKVVVADKPASPQHAAT